MINRYKKYPNRRFYDMQLKRYATIADIASAVRDGLSSEVRRHVGRKVEGPDITREVLMLTLGECESQRETPKLSVDQLRELIRG